MKKIILYTLTIVCIISCKKGSDSSNDPDYYFKCQVDNKQINLTASVNNTNPLVSLYSYVTGTISTQISASDYTQCPPPPGKYCFTSGILFSVTQLVVGTYTNPYFSLTTTVGTDNLEYVYGYTPSESITVTITKVIGPTIDKKGILEGTFTGVISKRINSTLQSAHFPISGSFSVPTTL